MDFKTERLLGRRLITQPNNYGLNHHESFKISTKEPTYIVVDWKLSKSLYFYQLLNPNSPKIFNYNVYQIAMIAITFIVQCLIVYGLLGNVTQRKEIANGYVIYQNMFMFIMDIQYLFIIIIFLNKSNELWSLLNITRPDFFTSTLCRNHIKILRKYGKRSKIFSYFFTIIGMFGLVLWVLFPLIYNKLSVEPLCEEMQRYEAVINFKFPITTCVFNDFFYIFYSIEVVIILWMIYIYIIYEIFFISMCFVIIAMNEIISQALQDVRYEQKQNINVNDDDMDMYYDEFKSILFDQQQVNLKLKSFYSVLWFLCVSSIVILSGSFIIIVYMIVMIFMSKKLMSVLDMIKLSFTSLLLCIMLFSLCYFIEKLNDKKQSARFGYYSIDWTMMNLKFKKLLLLSMIMDDANQLMIKITPKKVMMTSYNTISVMVKSLSNYD